MTLPHLVRLLEDECYPSFFFGWAPGMVILNCLVRGEKQE